MDYYKLDGNSLVRTPSVIEKNGTTYINNVEILKEEGYKPLVLDETVQENMISQGSTYTQDENYIYEHKIWKSLEEIQKEQENYESTRQFTVEEVIKTVFQQSINNYSIEDSKSLRMLEYYPIWENLVAQNVQLTDDDFENFKFTYQDELYKVIKPHTFSSAWVPGNGTESLYIRIDEEHDGDVYDPIPYEGNMVLVNGKYYTQDNVVYLCFRDTVNQVNNPLSELVEIYVKIVDITNL